MQLKELLDAGYIVILDPEANNTSMSEVLNVNSFLAEFGGAAEEIALVAKRETGFSTYRSMAAPKDSNYPTFFKDFTELVSNLGIISHGIVYSFGDAYMGADLNYTLKKSGDLEIRQFVCPTTPTYWRYLATVAKEVAKHPIQSLIFQEHFYPRAEYCFCRRCRSAFSEITGLPSDTFYSDVQKDEDLLNQFIAWRSEMITASLAEAADTAKSIKPDLEISFVIPIDPETGWFSEIEKNFGINLDQLGEIVNNFVFHIMPFSPLYPRENDDSWVLLRDGLNRLRSRYGINIDLMIWAVEDENSLDWFLKLKNAVKARKCFVRLDTPPLFSIKREIHRGLT